MGKSIYYVIAIFFILNVLGCEYADDEDLEYLEDREIEDRKFEGEDSCYAPEPANLPASERRLNVKCLEEFENEGLVYKDGNGEWCNKSGWKQIFKQAYGQGASSNYMKEYFKTSTKTSDCLPKYKHPIQFCYISHDY